MVSSLELLALIKVSGRVRVSYLEDRFIWSCEDKEELKAKMSELIDGGLIYSPAPGIICVVR